MRVYLDTNFFIRFVESDDPSGAFLFEAAASRSWSLLTSALTLAEVLVAPLKDGDHGLAGTYEALLRTTAFLTVAPVDEAVLRQSAVVRATIGNKTADAIHVATAICHSCDAFVTADSRIRLPDGIRQVPLEAVTNPDVWP